MFFGRNDAKAEPPVLWPPHEKSWLVGKDFDAGEGLGAGREGDDRGWDGWMASPTRWTCEFEWTPGVGNGPGDLACCNSWGHKESDMTEWTELNWVHCSFIIPLVVNFTFSGSSCSDDFALLIFWIHPYDKSPIYGRKPLLFYSQYSWYILEKSKQTGLIRQSSTLGHISLKLVYSAAFNELTFSLFSDYFNFHSILPQMKKFQTQSHLSP